MQHQKCCKLCGLKLNVENIFMSIVGFLQNKMKIYHIGKEMFKNYVNTEQQGGGGCENVHITLL